MANYKKIVIGLVMVLLGYTAAQPTAIMQGASMVAEEIVNVVKDSDDQND